MQHTNALGVCGGSIVGGADEAFRARAAILVARRRRWLCTRTPCVIAFGALSQASNEGRGKTSALPATGGRAAHQRTRRLPRRGRQWSRRGPPGRSRPPRCTLGHSLHRRSGRQAGRWHPGASHRHMAARLHALVCSEERRQRETAETATDMQKRDRISTWRHQQVLHQRRRGAHWGKWGGRRSRRGRSCLLYTSPSPRD